LGKKSTKERQGKNKKEKNKRKTKEYAKKGEQRVRTTPKSPP